MQDHYFPRSDIPETKVKQQEVKAYLGGFSNFLPNSLPLIRLVILDGREQSLTLFEHQHVPYA